MLTMNLSDIALVCQGQLIGDDQPISSICTDSRHIAPEELFIALVGDHFDGHHYLQQVAQCGAGAALVSQDIELDIPIVRVKDTRIALGQIAAWQRQQFTGPVAAITGSNGKTTVKEMLSAILNLKYNVLFTQGNFNNDIGLPLTLLRLNEEHQAMVLELGANHPGEITYTANIAKADVALVNNVGDAHIEGFGSRDGVANEKSEIFAALDEQGCAVFESDSPYLNLFKQKTDKARSVSFGLSQTADVWAEDAKCLSDGCYQFNLCCGVESALVKLKTPGLHNVKNGCAASAMALQMGMSVDECAKALSEFSGVSGRLRRLKLSEHITLFDDTYNANPNSFNAALDVLCSRDSFAMLVAGDMGELGEQSKSAHQALGEQAKARHIELIATGAQMKYAAQSAGDYGLYYDDQQSLAKALLARLHELDAHHSNALVVVKGSRSSQMEKTVQFIQQNFNKVHQC
ncbi:UDP-N-acetylmuramoyl-tripeptide--D-alanyl-D-alanine ligase [Celerinatantimonas sp. MCCC 1A17872]|uniref:UDP-N-acetylmuramoyl-tripeptide--D-alanyl-D- alanine ligase n=1 Tax=Celerinatantimonas sp. MCCC 1A17872 TaxID=3177514 RepID=UPI0038C1C629